MLIFEIVQYGTDIAIMVYTFFIILFGWNFRQGNIKFLCNFFQYIVIAHKIIGKTEISNSVIDGKVTINTNTTAYAAGICAYNDSSDIVKCECEVEVTVNTDDTGYVAGICAYLYSDARLSECINYGVIDGDAETLYRGGVYAETEADATNSSRVPAIEGCMSFEGIRPGDANGDGVVSPVDVIVMTRSLAKFGAYENAVNLANSDLNADGKITSIDIICLSRHLAGWKGYETLLSNSGN